MTPRAPCVTMRSQGREVSKSRVNCKTRDMRKFSQHAGGQAGVNVEERQARPSAGLTKVAKSPTNNDRSRRA